MQPKKQGRGKKSKRKDERPARKRYWAKRMLEDHKVTHLVKCCGMDYIQALRYWRSVRIGRVPAGYIK